MHRNYYSSSFNSANGPSVGPGGSCHSRSSQANSSSQNYHKYDHLVNNGNPNLNMRSIYENYLNTHGRQQERQERGAERAPYYHRQVSPCFDDNEYPIPTTTKIQYYAEPDTGYGGKSLSSNNSSFCSSLNRYSNSNISNNSNSIALPPLSPTRDERETSTSRFLAAYDPLTETENLLRSKWLDNSPRMSRLREHRQKRLMNKLEQFELWDAEQEQKQKQYDLAREQRYKNIMERLKSQEFCVNLMKKRHESDLETTRELEAYPIEHHYVDVLDDPKTDYRGPVSQYRKFQAEMDNKLRNLQHDLDLVNPRYRIEQAIIPRLERTRELYSVEPDTYTQRGKRVQKRPPPLNKPNNKPANASETYQNYHTISRDRPSILSQSLTRSAANSNSKLKPIIHNSNQDESSKPRSPKGGSEQKKAVYFNDDVEYSSRKESIGSEEVPASNGDGKGEPAGANSTPSTSSPPRSPSSANDKAEPTSSE